MSRLLKDEFPRWMVLPYWEISKALETTPQEGVVFECYLWVATQWLTKCAQLLRRNMASAEGLDEEAQEAIPPGPLCKSVPPRSLERWNFWRSRLAELASAGLQRETTAQGSPCPVKGRHPHSASRRRLLRWTRQPTAPRGRDGDVARRLSLKAPVADNVLSLHAHPILSPFATLNMSRCRPGPDVGARVLDSNNVRDVVRRWVGGNSGVTDLVVGNLVACVF